VSGRRVTPESRRAQLLAELADVCGLQLEPGNAYLVTLGDGRVVAELKIDIRQAVTDQELAEWRARSLRLLAALDIWRCEATTRRKRSPWDERHARCSRQASGAVIYRGRVLGDPIVQLLCDQHAARGGDEPAARVLARLTFWPHELREARELGEARRAAAAKASAGGAA
jgi:hypothetical protein